MDKYKKLDKEIKEYLIAKGVYDAVDTTLIGLLSYNVYLCDESRKDIKDRGFTVNIRKDPEDNPYYQANQSIAIFANSVKSVLSISTKLGLTVTDRSKLKIQTKAEDVADELDSVIDD